MPESITWQITEGKDFTKPDSYNTLRNKLEHASMWVLRQRVIYNI